MKNLILIIIVFINAGSLIAQNSKLDTLVNAIWDGTAWQNRSRTINNYDADCRLKTALKQNWDDATAKWIDYSISAYIYVSENYINQILIQLWLNNSWTNNYRLTYTYDVSFKILSIVGQTWSFDHWSNYISTSNKYDNNGYADSVLVQLSYEDHPFENSSLTININNNDGTLQQTINKIWNKATLSWDNASKYSVVYNNHKTIDTATTALWNYNAALWQFQTRSIFTYSGTGKLFYYIIQGWQTSKWVNQSQYTNSYDNNGFVSNVLDESWDGFDFEKYNQDTYKNNSDGTIYQHVAQYWSNVINNWVNNTRETYSYSASCVLPLRLILFTATKNNYTVNLNWQSANEINSSHFTVQRSFNGADFTSLGDIPAKNGADINSYAYSDSIENTKANKIYYRLKIIDNDGLNTFSKVIPVALSANTSEFKVYPNPATDQLYILFNVQNTTKVELKITDVSGKIVYRNTVNINQGNSIANINISSFSRGVYYVLLSTDNGVQRAQFIKQ